MSNNENFQFNPDREGKGKTAEEMSSEALAIIEEFERTSVVGGSTYESRRVGRDIHLIKVKPGGEEVHRNLGPKPQG